MRHCPGGEAAGRVLRNVWVARGAPSAKPIAYAKSKGMFVITDGKRNDIGSTMEAYAAAHLGKTKVGGAEIAALAETR